MTPGEHLRTELQRLGLDQKTAGGELGCSRQTINNVINGRQSISRALAAKLGKLTGHTPGYWLRPVFFLDGRELPEPVPGVLSGDDIVHLIEAGQIALSPFDPAQVGPASVALTIGPSGGDTGDATAHISIGPGAGATLIARERVSLPTNYLGHVFVSGRLASKGLIAASRQIPPGYSGWIEAHLFNPTPETLILPIGSSFLDLEIVRLAASPSMAMGRSRKAGPAG